MQTKTRLTDSTASESENPGVFAIVEDDLELGLALVSWFDMRGSKASHHGSAESLLQMIDAGGMVPLPGSQAEPAAGQAPLLGAVLDLNLPGQSGVQLAFRLRQMYPHIPLVMITALRPAERARFGTLPEGVRCLTKPFDLDGLEEALFPA